MKRWSLLVLVLVAGIWGWLVLRGPVATEAPAARTWTVSAERHPGVVRERGWVVTSRTMPVISLVGGDLAELAETGTRVHKGDVVLRVDEGSVHEQLEEKEMDYTSGLVDIELAEAERELTRVKQENLITLQRRRLDFARMEYEDAVSGMDAPTRRLGEIEIELAELKVADAREELERQKRLEEKGFASASMVEPYERRTTSAAAALAEARLRLDLESKGVPDERLLELKRLVERYEASVARGQEALARRLAAADTEIEAQRVRLTRDSNTLARVRQDFSNTVVRAGMDGVVRVRMYSDWRGGGQWVPYRPGQRIRKHDWIADVVDLGRMGIRLMVHEADVNRLTVGMPVTVRVPAFPGQVFTGTLTELGGVGRDRYDVAPRGFEKVRSGVTMFNARVELDGVGVEFRPGMSAIVAFGVEPAPSGYLVPRECVWRREGRLYVRKQAAGKVHEVAVEGVLFDERDYSIRTGVEPGDVLIAGEVR